MKKKKLIFVIFAGGVLTICLVLSLLVLRLTLRINNSLKTSWFPPSIKYYTALEKVTLGQNLSPKKLKEKLEQRYYIFSNDTSPLEAGHVLSHTGKNCPNFLPTTKVKEKDIYYDEEDELINDSLADDELADDDPSKIKPTPDTKALTLASLPLDQFKKCLLWRARHTNTLFTAGFVNNQLYFLKKNDQAVESVYLEPILFAEYENGEPVLRQIKPLSAFPFNCRQAVLSAEDHQFILHEGISLKAITRAIWNNIRKFRLAEGGSTITQQLAKNLFFTQEKSFWRKFQEQIMALLLEIKLSKQSPKDKIFKDIKDPKDKILTAYLNIIYMGQSGFFPVYGFGSASKHYLNKSVSDLDLSECALLAGIIKSPGQYKPSENNKKILLRRNHILHTMFEKQIINEEELNKALSKPIKAHLKKYNPPAYFTSAVYKQIKKLNLPEEKGLKVFTTLYPDFQDKADKAIQQGLNWLEKNRLKKNLKDKVLQSALINVEVSTGAVRAVTGGRDFKVSQFNRAIQAKRQIGSLMKPVVLLSALMENQSLNPLSMVEDKKFTHKYDSQSWSPKNYKEHYKGPVPLYLILTHSLNAGTAQVGLKTGLNSIAQTLKNLGGPKKVTTHPSLILGALELSPWEVAQIFLTIANMGEHKQQHIIRKVTNLSDQILYEHKLQTLSDLKEQKAHQAKNLSLAKKLSLAKESSKAPELSKKPESSKSSKRLELKSTILAEKTAVLVGMLKEVTKSGTARGLKSFPLPVGGKTGTTNEEKDAWFVGFTPESLTVVWVGFDDNLSHYLTGAGGALPIWKMFMKGILPSLSNKDFDWPKGVQYQRVQAFKQSQKKAPNTKEIAPEALEKKPKEKDSDTNQTLQLIFEQ